MLGFKAYATTLADLLPKAESRFSNWKDPENLLKNLVLIYDKKKM